MPAPKIRTNTKKYAAAVAAQEETDRQYLMELYAPPTHHCIGGRVVHVGVVCDHCGSDSPVSKCLESVEQLMQAKADRQKELTEFKF